ncbi:hypothetical protein BDI4_830028 [Burkholderia diffusa]|uniref:hypothetical protein n=1 Tax=Burkholderia diffusa TaxID=488732 RepID=UPI001CB34B89|nr:hypothetical protein [Burkholderia diffusa]CAG9264305.1 hypothetical protein BDI4_830028 [Burkholderia diffusa]
MLLYQLLDPESKSDEPLSEPELQSEALGVASKLAPRLELESHVQLSPELLEVVSAGLVLVSIGVDATHPGSTLVEAS